MEQDLVVLLSTVCRQSLYHRRLLVDVAHDTVDDIVQAVGHTEVQRRNVHNLWGLQTAMHFHPNEDWVFL